MIALFFDTETTGFKREDFTPEIVQIAAILQNTESGRVLAEINLIVTPNGIIPDQVAEIHGITTELARTYGFDPSYAAGIFQSLLNCSDLLVAHNIEFDMEMLELNWYDTWLVATEKDGFDTMNEARLIVDLPPGNYHGNYTEGPKPPRLSEAYEFFTGRKLENAHDAMVDVRACRDVYFGIKAYQAKKEH